MYLTRSASFFISYSLLHDTAPSYIQCPADTSFISYSRSQPLPPTARSNIVAPILNRLFPNRTHSPRPHRCSCQVSQLGKDRKVRRKGVGRGMGARSVRHTRRGRCAKTVRVPLVGPRHRGTRSSWLSPPSPIKNTHTTPLPPLTARRPNKFFSWRTTKRTGGVQMATRVASCTLPDASARASSGLWARRPSHCRRSSAGWRRWMARRHECMGAPTSPILGGTPSPKQHEVLQNHLHQ